MNKKKTRNSRNFHNSDSAQSFADILRQTADMHRDDPRDSIKGLLAIARHTESTTDADEAVAIPRDEYNCLIVAKATLGLFIAARKNNALPDYDICKLLDMIANADADKSKDT